MIIFVDRIKFFFSIILVICLATSFGCVEGDDDDDDSGNPPDGNDDVDDDIDDDADDDLNDDADDDVNDDTDDDADDDIDDDVDDDIDDDTELTIEWIDGGAVGMDGITLAVGPDGTQYMAAAKARVLFLYSKESGGAWESELVVYFAATPKLAIDSSGFIHLLYRHLEESCLMYGTNASSIWEFEQIANGNYENIDYHVVVGSDDRAHITHTTINPETYDYIFNYAVKSGRAWDETIIAEGDRAGRYHDIALDSAGNPHLAYQFDDTLVYAVNNEGSWSYETTDEYIYDMDPMALDIDASDYAHIAWTRGSYPEGPVRYATNQSGAWVTVDIAMTQERGLDLGVDAGGKIHIAFLSSERSLTYVTNESGDWVETPIDTWPEDNTIPPEIAFDDSGNVLIGYFKFESYFLGSAYCAAKLGGNFSLELVDKGKTVGLNSLLELDNQSRPLITYYDWHELNLKFARKIDGRWELEAIDDTQHIGGGGDSVTDESGTVHISYCSPDVVGVNYATNAARGWTIERIPDLQVDGVGQTAIDLDADGYVHIIYNAPDFRWDRVKYLTNKSGLWISTTIEESDNFSDDPAIVATDDGLVHVAYSGYHYYHEGETGLKYGVKEGFSWSTTLIDYDGNGADMVIDPDGKAHVTYYDMDDNLWYATNQSGEFSLEMVDGSGEAMFYSRPSMDMDEQGVIHVAFNYDYGGKLGYAMKAQGIWFNKMIPGTGDRSEYASMKLDDLGRVHVAFHGDEALWYARFPKGYGAPPLNDRRILEVKP